MTTKPSRLLHAVRRVYDEVEAALWASLVAFVIFFSVFVVPEIPQKQFEAMLVRDREVAVENDRYCTKWGKQAGTREHMLCTMDLQELRSRIVQRLRDDALF